jgi:hypothetical protein
LRHEQEQDNCDYGSGTNKANGLFVHWPPLRENKRHLGWSLTAWALMKRRSLQSEQSWFDQSIVYKP